MEVPECKAPTGENFVDVRCGLTDYYTLLTAEDLARGKRARESIDVITFEGEEAVGT